MNNDILIQIYNNIVPDVLKNMTKEQAKIYISKLEYMIFPLYCIETNMIYLIDSENIYSRIINENYRFPDQFIYEYLKAKLTTYNNEMSSVESDEDIYLIHIKISNIKNSINFLNNFDLDILKEQFIKVFDSMGESKYKEFSTCIRPSYTSILPNTYYIKPYFSYDELKKNNIIYKNKETNDIHDLCYISVMRDIHYSKLIRHMKHIIENNGAGILQYYSLIGSYNINNYMRELYPNTKYRNQAIDGIIRKFWEIIITAPAFDEDFYIYRFINDDSFLQDLKIGDTYMDKGFMSCTRDPYYVSNYYSFGNNMMKIKVPKNKIGVGLCLELFSHFGREQEILLAPNTSMVLVGVDNNVKYEHTNMDITIKLKKKYEFIITDKQPIKMPMKIDVKIQSIDNLYNLSKPSFYDIKSKYLNEVNTVQFKIGPTYKLLTIDMIKISEAYSTKGFYIGSDNGAIDEIVIYHINNNMIIFFIEIIENDDKFDIYVNINNYYNYINQRVEDVFNINDFLIFLKKIGNYFNTTEIIISCDFISCEYFKDNTKLRMIIEDYRDILGGNFNIEIYNYFKYNKIRFNDYIKKDIITPLFDIHILDKYSKLEMSNIINLTDSIELKQVFESFEKVKNTKITVKEFYIYIKENKCFLTSELSYIIALYEQKDNISDENINPFYNPFYIFNSDKLS